MSNFNSFLLLALASESTNFILLTFIALNASIPYSNKKVATLVARYSALTHHFVSAVVDMPIVRFEGLPADASVCCRCP